MTWTLDHWYDGAAHAPADGDAADGSIAAMAAADAPRLFGGVEALHHGAPTKCVTVAL